MEEFVEMSRVIGNDPRVSAIELNISCPNLENDGKAFGMDADIYYELIKKVKAITDQPIIAKLFSDVTSIQEIAISCEKAGADALNVANTLLAMSIDIYSRKPKIGNVMGGVSGPVIKPIVVRLIHQVRKASNLPIIECGGVMNWDDAIELILAGVSAVQVGTASFINPNAMINIIEGIKQYMIDYDIADINDLLGKVKIETDEIKAF